MKPTIIAPDGLWHLAIRSPDGFGFDIALKSEAELNETIDALAKCINEPGGIAQQLKQVTTFLAT